MDKALLAQGFTIMPGNDGSFVVRPRDEDYGRAISEFWAFTTAGDLSVWFDKQVAEYHRIERSVIKEPTTFVVVPAGTGCVLCDTQEAG